MIRYTLERDEDGGYICEDIDGEYVKYEQHAAEVNRIIAERKPPLILLQKLHAEMRRWKSCQSIGVCRQCVDDGLLLQLGLYLEELKRSSAALEKP